MRDRQGGWRLRVLLILLAIVAGGTTMPAWTDILSVPLVNNSGLDTNRYTIYVLGFSTGRTDPTVVAPVVLSADTNKLGKFIVQTNDSGFVNSYKMGDEINSIAVDRSSDKIAGARVFFFVADNQLPYSSNGLPPRFAFSGTGSAVVQCPNPPQSDYPIYNYIEFTYIHGDNYGAVIDVSAVDGFNFPISITMNDNLASPLGQPTDVASSKFNRQLILDGYRSFMTNLAAEGGSDYLCLYHTNNLGGLLNPTFYLDPDHNEEGLLSQLNHVFDDALNEFFSASNALTLSITTDGAGSVTQDTYHAEYNAAAVFPGTDLTHPALVFTGTNYHHTYTVFNPVDFTVVNYLDPSTNLQYIHGQMSNTFVNFTSPLPADTPIVVGMYVVGPGANADSKVVAIQTNAYGLITTLTLNNGEGIASAGNFRFSKAKDVNAVSSGTMVFGCYALFDHPQGLVGDEQKVLLALKRDIVTAFNRGVANLSPVSGPSGRTSTYWGMQTNWYPEGQAQNLFSLYMHTACVKDGTNDIPVFTRPDNATHCARGSLMGMSYGFAYDENSVHINIVQPQVPAKHDPLPASVSNTTVMLGPWRVIETVTPDNDFDEDGIHDLTVYHEASGYFYIFLSGSGELGCVKLGGPGYKPVLGDYDGDAKTDVGVYDEASGCWFILLSSNGYSLSSTQFGATGYTPVPGDFDGDGKTDLAVYCESGDMPGYWFIFKSSDYSVSSMPFGGPGYAPVPGDYDGDGKTDLAVYCEAGDMPGYWFIFNSSDYSMSYMQFGAAGYAPVPGDYDGDGITDLAVYCEAGDMPGYWFIFRSSDYELAYMQFGAPGYTPVPGDYDGDGITDIAVYQEASGYWYILLSESSYAMTYQKFGDVGYKPVR